MAHEGELSTDEQRALVLEHLERRETIREATRESLEAAVAPPVQDPLAHVDVELRERVEDEFFEARGKRRYQTSDGRVIFLTPREIEQRRRARSKKNKKRRRGGGYGYYGPSSRRSRWSNIAFNVGAVALALVFVYLILR